MGHGGRVSGETEEVYKQDITSELLVKSVVDLGVGPRGKTKLSFPPPPPPSLAQGLFLPLKHIN